MDKIKTLQSVALSLSERGEEPALYEFQKGDVKVSSFAELDDFSKKLAAGLVQAGLNLVLTQSFSPRIELNGSLLAWRFIGLE